jgi:hypothetical protein
MIEADQRVDNGRFETQTVADSCGNEMRVADDQEKRVSYHVGAFGVALYGLCQSVDTSSRHESDHGRTSQANRLVREFLASNPLGHDHVRL